MVNRFTFVSIQFYKKSKSLFRYFKMLRLNNLSISGLIFVVAIYVDWFMSKTCPST
jgi:hypothetical protein